MSDFGKINWFDILKGFLVAALTVVITGLVQSLENGTFPTWEEISGLLIYGLAAGLAYLLKNVFTNSENKLGKKELK